VFFVPFSGFVVQARLTVHPNTMFAPTEVYNDITYSVRHRAGGGVSLSVEGLVTPDFLGQSLGMCGRFVRQCCCLIQVCVAAARGRKAAVLFIDTALKHERIAPVPRAVFGKPLYPVEVKQIRAATKAPSRWSVLMYSITYSTHPLTFDHVQGSGHVPAFRSRYGFRRGGRVSCAACSCRVVDPGSVVAFGVVMFAEEFGTGRPVASA
jgi:hypothetical protein